MALCAMRGRLRREPRRRHARCKRHQRRHRRLSLRTPNTAPAGRQARRPAAPWIYLALGVAGLAALVVCLGGDVFGARAEGFDRWIRDNVHGRRSPRVDAIAHAISVAATPSFLYAVAAGGALFVLWRRGWRSSVGVAISAMLAWGLHNAAKSYFARVRPPGGLDHESHSFPSGHVTTTAAVLVTMAYSLWRERLIPPAAALVLGGAGPIVVAWSRVRLDQHWATDVLAGWCLGLAVAGVSGLIHRRLVRDHQR